MSKRKQSSSAVSFPEVVNMDDLAYLSDEELSGRAGRLESERRRAASTSSLLTPWEVEIAYVRREQQIRESRSAAHTEWLKTAPRAEAEAHFEEEGE